MWNYRNKVKLHMFRKSLSLKGTSRNQTQWFSKTSVLLFCIPVYEKSGTIPGFLLFIWSNTYNMFSTNLFYQWFFSVILWNGFHLEYQIFVAHGHAICWGREQHIFTLEQKWCNMWVFIEKNACFNFCTALLRMALCVAGIGISIYSGISILRTVFDYQTLF